MLDATSAYELYFNRIYLDEKVTYGAVLVYVEENKPAASAGLKKGDVIMIIESMKLMNEVQSDYSGTVKEILVQNGEAVEYDQPIMIIE